MDIDHWIKLLQTLISLLQVIIWPSIVGFAILYLGKTLRNYVDDLRRDKNVHELSAEVSTTGVKFNVKRQVEVVNNLALAESQYTETQGSEKVGMKIKTKEVLHTVNKVITSKTVQNVAGARVLWVDDNPSNNTYERRALEALGLQFMLSTSTEDALEKLRSESYDVIISDMGRPPDSRAGYTLLGQLQKCNVFTPFIIYAGSNRPDHKAETIKRGGFGTTNNPQELFQLVIDAIQGS